MNIYHAIMNRVSLVFLTVFLFYCYLSKAN